MKRNLLNLSIDELNKVLQKEYLKLAEKLISYLLELYVQIIEEGTDALHSHLYSYNRYYEMLGKIEQELAKFGIKENKIFDERLTDLYQRNSEVIGESFHLGTYINKEEIKNIIRRDWVGDGMNYSYRIWKDKQKLAETLQSELVECVGTGASPEKMTKRLMERFSVSYSNAKRLAITEMAHCYNESALNKYIQAGITKVKILNNDPNICDICKEYRGKVYPIDECPMLPAHPYCKCTYTAVVE